MQIHSGPDPEKLSGMTMAALEAELKAIKAIIADCEACEADASAKRLIKYYVWMRDRIQAEIDKRKVKYD